MTDILASARTALISRLRKEKDQTIREHLSSTLKLLEIREQASDPETIGRVSQYLAWHLEHLSAIDGEDGR